MGFYSKSGGDLEKALELMWQEHDQKKIKCYPNHLFLETTVQGKDGVGYFKYSYVSRQELESRPHILEWYDYAVGVVWLDVWHERTPNGYQNVAREEKDVGVFVERRR